MTFRAISLLAIITLIVTLAGCDRVAPQQGRAAGRGMTAQLESQDMATAFSKPRGLDQGIFDPLSDIGQRALTAFTASVAVLVVVISAVLPWLVVLFFAGWGFLKLLRIYLRHKRARKRKKDDH